MVNDGLFAANCAALLAVDATLRTMPGAAAWLDARPDLGWCHQLLFNLALARLRCAAALDEAYNLQLNSR